MRLNTGPESIPVLRKRFLLLSLAAVAIFVLLLMRLWYLQVIRVDQYRAMSEKNRTRQLTIAPPRGPIFDRDGEILVDNRPAFGVSVLRQEVEDSDRLLARLALLLGVEPAELQRRWAKGRRLPAFRPTPLATDVGRDLMEQIQENSGDLPGVLIEVKPVRAYPHGESAAHLFGYLGEITERDLQSGKFDDYTGGDDIGKSGLEKYLESYLRGTDGERRVEVDAKGRELRLLKTLDPAPGNKVFLTLQSDLQAAAEEAFGDKTGAAVALDVRTGEVLAMVSRPSFDPALFAEGISGARWEELLQNPLHPLQNKALQGQYPPGSTFKIVTALAALQAGVVTPATTVDCTGSFELGNSQYRCWKKEGHGKTDLKKALRESCDVWFYKAGLAVGIDRLSEMAFQLGLGRSLELPLDGEKNGLIPTRAWKRRRYNAGWFDGETVIASIGQGFVLATPLQLAVMTAAVANGGEVLRPQVVRRIEDTHGNILLEAKPQVLHEPNLAEADLAAVRRGLEAVVNEAGGTGWSSHLDEVRVAGKTGTAQVVKRKEDDEKDQAVAYLFRDHALFVAYAPAREPKIAVAVVVEHGGHGGSAAGPIAKAIFSSYFGIVPQTTVDSEVGFAGD